jgi:hypothetical protein
MRKFTAILITAIPGFLCACGAAPTRLDKAAFTSLQQGKVPPQKTQEFTDCLMDGFSTSHGALANISVRQQRRAEGMRVEAVTNAIILVSVDVLNTGQVEIYESSSAALVNTSGERETFKKCLELLGTNVQ